MEMDMIIPLNLNLNKKSVRQLPEGDSNPNENKSPPKPVLGREQAKKRLLAFAQQWNKTKENLNADKALQKKPNQHGTLKYTYVVEGEDGSEISFPAHLIQYTVTEPSISYCENPHYAKGVYQTRTEVLDTVDEDVKRVMYFIMNSSSPYCQNREFPGRYRKWYADKRTFIGKPQEEPEEQLVRYSPHWESDSEDEYHHQDLNNYDTDFLPKPAPILPTTKVISKVKINKRELPFFEDDDFLSGLISSQTKEERNSEPSKLNNKERNSEPSKDEIKDIQQEYSAFMSSLGSVNEKPEDHRQDRQMSLKSPVTQDWNMEDENVSREIQDDEDEKRPAQSPDWDEQWRSSRYRRPNEQTRSPSPFHKREGVPRTPDESDVKTEDDWTVGQQSVHYEDTEGNSSMAPDAKRISLDERLELELGIKVETGQHSMLSPQSMDHLSSEPSPHRRRRGFGPKAAPLGALIFSCPKAFPAAPFIPPHLQSLLYQPLVRTVALKTEEVKTGEGQTEGDEEKKNDPLAPATPDKELKKDWDKELKNLEAVASNLEAADETVLEALEEKLLLFETTNIIQSGGDESPTSEIKEEKEEKEEKSKSVKRPKRPKPPPIELKEAGKGILVMPRVTLLDEENASQKKAVLFADNVRPGYGTSSEDEDEHVRSPPPPIAPAIPPVENSPNKKSKRRKKEKFVGNDFDPVFDLLPPPPPPPGSPPPHLPRRSPSIPSPTPPSVDNVDSADTTIVDSSPQAIESGAC